MTYGRAIPAALKTPPVPPPAPPKLGALPAGDDDLLRDKFQSVMGEMLFGQMLESMRKTVGRPPYFHGGQAEEIFTQQLDQVLAEKISQTSAEAFTGPMYELWTMQRTR